MIEEKRGNVESQGYLAILDDVEKEYRETRENLRRERENAVQALKDWADRFNQIQHEDYEHFAQYFPADLDLYRKNTEALLAEIKVLTGKISIMNDAYNSIPTLKMLISDIVSGNTKLDRVTLQQGEGLNIYDALIRARKSGTKIHIDASHIQVDRYVLVQLPDTKLALKGYYADDPEVKKPITFEIVPMPSKE